MEYGKRSFFICFFMNFCVVSVVVRLVCYHFFAIGLSVALIVMLVIDRTASSLGCTFTSGRLSRGGGRDRGMSSCRRCRDRQTTAAVDVAQDDV